MKKSKVITLVLISTSFASCMEYDSIVVVPNKNGQDNDSTRIYSYQPYNAYCDYFNYNSCWNPFHFLWNSHRRAACYNAQGLPAHYGPRHIIGSNTARQAARTLGSGVVSRGGFGHIGAHSVAG